MSQLVEVSLERPYLSLRLDRDPSLVASVMLEAGVPALRSNTVSIRALDMSCLDGTFLDAAVRLVRFMEAPATEARVMFPLITHEVVFRILAGAPSARLRQIAVPDEHTDRIARAVKRLRRDYDKPLRINNLARNLSMSPSGFREHFKAVTAISPLQLQKQIRLQEARRLLLGGDMDAATAAFQVGCDGVTHFNREDKRLFGEPSKREVERM